jgi:hypothetical protein
MRFLQRTCVSVQRTPVHLSTVHAMHKIGCDIYRDTYIERFLYINIVRSPTSNHLFIFLLDVWK